ncbi:MAG: TetR family transcriptional regulator C-terminal domain-containing protein [Beijerinckiaceae bacterium]
MDQAKSHVLWRSGPRPPHFRISRAITSGPIVERRRVGIRLWAEALRNERILAIVREGVDAPRKLLAGLIKDVQRRGKLRPDLKPDAVARVLIALYHGFVLQQAWDEEAELEPFLAVVAAALGTLVWESPGN